MPIDPNNLSGTAVMTFDDEFNTLSLWNGTSGTWTTTYPFADPAGNGSTLAGNGEQEWYVNSNYAPTASVTPWTVANGDLHLTAAPAAASIQPLINGYQYTSGQLNTVHSFSQTYGYFEMRAELPAGQGMWPAFWLLPQNGAWPPELDVMEVLGNSPTTLYTTVHTASTGTNTQQGVATTTPDTSKGFHTYAVDWEPDYITWYFDGKAIDRVATPSDMNSPMYMLLNLAVGGSWPGDVNATTPFPADMSVDWVHAYRSLPGGAAALSPSTAVPATGTGDVLSAAGAPVALTAGGAATSAAMLSTGAIVVGGAKTLASGGGFSGIADLYSTSGAQSGGDVALTGWAGAQSGMSPQVTALPGGFWEVTYTGAGAPAGSEIYNASGTLTFLDNAFTTGSPVFTTLPDGSWVEASSNAPGRFEIVQASGQTTWLALPTVGGAQPTPSAAITLGDGGFAFSYAGSTELDRYSANAGIHTTMQLASTPVSTALGVAGFTDGVTEAAWLAAGANGTTSLRLESFGPLGQVQAAAVTLAASVDATTEIRMLGTGVHDQSLVLWSTGGTVYGAAFDGTTASAATALAPGALDGVQSAVLTDGDIALSWLERDNGVQHLWAEVVDPSTMQATRQDLGAADGSARLVALQGGGFAESWHAGGAIEGVVYDGLGHYGAAVDVSGDFVGVNSQGQLLAVGTGGSGPASLQAYSLGDGTAAPSVSIASAGGLTNQLAQTVSGTAAAGTTVTLYEDTSATGAFATKAGSATVGADGTWSIGVTFSGDGAHYVEALDQAPSGATAASAPVGYTLDTTAPAVSLRLVSDTGVSSSDAITSSPALSGTGDPNAVVHFTIDGMSLSATASADASGTWSFLPTGLADGRHVVVASETDAAGNAGSSSLDFTLDTHPAAAAFGNFTETAVKGGYKLTLTGTASDAASSVQTVSIYEDGHPIGTVHPANGLWSFTDPLVTNAVHKFTLTTLDAAGNTGPGVQTLILGHSGANTLTGVAGAAVIYGGAGADTLTGAPGTNTYVYHAASDAPLPKGWLSPIETITNFHEATDRIDLSALGPLAYGGETKAMTAHHIDWYVAGGNTYVSVDVTGDRHPDMLIELNGLHTLSSADFIHG